MTAGSITTNERQKGILQSAYEGTTSLPEYFVFGIGSTQLTETSTDVDERIPIYAEIINDDGSTNMTGSDGGDNSTDNTTTYKTGAGTSDTTSQNLIANDTNVSKVWELDISASGFIITGTYFAAQWLYIKDATALAKFKTSGTCLEIKYGSSSANYYSKTWEASDLAIGWNWLPTYDTAVEDLTETGTVAGNIDTFIIEITTNNATDEFVAGDVIYDILRSYEEDDTHLAIKAGYPLVNESEIYVELQSRLERIYAVGFDITQIGIFNDTDELIHGIELFDSESKSALDIFNNKFIMRIRNRRVNI